MRDFKLFKSILQTAQCRFSDEKYEELILGVAKGKVKKEEIALFFKNAQKKKS